MHWWSPNWHSLYTTPTSTHLACIQHFKCSPIKVMIPTFLFFLTARGSNLMRQEGREVLAVPLHPQTHASFVGGYPSYKRSVLSAWSKQSEALNIRKTWCSFQNPAISKTAQTTTLLTLEPVQSRRANNHIFRMVHSKKKTQVQHDQSNLRWSPQLLQPFSPPTFLSTSTK